MEKPKLTLDDAYIVECENSEESREVANFIKKDMFMYTFFKYIINHKGLLNNKHLYYNVWDNIPEQVEHLPIITFKEWKEMFNQTKQNMSYKYTPEYCKNNKVAFIVETCQEVKQIETLFNIKVMNGWTYFHNEKPTGLINYHIKQGTAHGKMYWYEENNYEIIQASEFIKNNTKQNMQKEIIGYKLIKEDYYNAAIKLAPNCFFSGHKIFDKTAIAVKHWKDAGVLDIWFEPVFSNQEKIINIGFDVKVTSEGIFHGSDNITEFVEKMYKEYNSLHSCTFGNYKAKFKDIIWESTGCQNVETKLSDWKKIWETYQEMFKSLAEYIKENKL